MMPVEEGKTCSAGQSKICAAAAQVARRGQAGFSGGAVCVAGIDGDHAHQAAVARRCCLSTMRGRR